MLMTEVITVKTNDGARRPESDRLPQHIRVVEDHVDTDELLEHRQPDAHPDDAVDAAGRLAQVAPRRRLLGLSDSWMRVIVSSRFFSPSSTREHLAGFRNPEFRNEDSAATRGW